MKKFKTLILNIKGNVMIENSMFENHRIIIIELNGAI